MPAMNLSVVVPVYKGETLIEPLVAELNRSLPSFAEEYEIILVNDGSPDHSWDVIQSLASKSKTIKGVRLMRNYGQHNATLCGVRTAIVLYKLDWIWRDLFILLHSCLSLEFSESIWLKCFAVHIMPPVTNCASHRVKRRNL